MDGKMAKAKKYDEGRGSSDKSILEDALAQFQVCEAAETQMRQDALDDIQFARLAQQWPEDVRRQRELEGRPCLTVNKLPSFVRQVVNDARQNKPSINTSPSDSSADPAISRVLDGLIRNIEYSSNADICYDTALEHAVDGGFGYFGIDIDYAHEDTFDLDINYRRFANRFMVYGDPMSTAADSSDWNCAFVIEDMKRDVFERAYPDAEPAGWSLGPAESSWLTEDTVRRAEYWTREEYVKPIVQLSDGTVLSAEDYENPERRQIFDMAGLTVTGTRDTRCYRVRQVLMTAGNVLEKNKWVGRWIPIIPVYGEEVNEEGKRWFRSLVRDARDPQRMFNYWRSAATELVALAPKVPWVGPRGFANSNPEKWESSNVKSHAYLEYDGQVEPKRQQLDPGPATGAIQEAMNASDDMKAVMGIYDASLGARSNETSGRAILARQREGDTGTFHFTDNLTRAVRHAGRILVDLIPKVYTPPRIIRILGEDKQMQEVRLGQPIPGQQPQSPTFSPKIYDLTIGKYDVVVRSGPSYSTRREEAAVQMGEFMKAVPNAAPAVAGPMARAMDWPEADKIAERMDAMLPPHVKGQGPPPEVMQMQQQMQQMSQQLQQLAVENQKLELKVEKAGVEKLKTQVDAEVKVAKAEMQAASCQMDSQKAQATTEIISLDAEKTRESAEHAKSQVDSLAPIMQQVAQTNDLLAQLIAALPAALQPKPRSRKHTFTKDQTNGSWTVVADDETMQ